jgi:hypothetical protein
LTPNDAKLVTAGAKVLVEEPDLKISTPGDVSLVADRPGTNGVDPQKLYLQVTPRDAPPQLLGASVKLTIALTTTSGDVLAVPTSALTVGADGAPRVQVERSDHTTHYVAVTPGLVAQGLVEVTAPKGDLAAGDNVVVGARKPGFVPPGAAAAPSTTSTTPSTTSTSVH